MMTSFHIQIRKPGLWSLVLMGLSAVLLSLWMVGCAEKPTETPIPKLAPETSISAITVQGEKTTVYAKGTDSDGVVEEYRFRVDGGEWTAWQKSSIYEFSMIYGSMDEAHTVEAMARDSDALEDPTPAKLTYTPNRIGAYNRPPDTLIKTPPPGARTSGGVVFSWDGLDPDGSIQGYEYSLDGSGWSRVGADTKSLLRSGLADGGHTFMVRTIDNLGVPDPTPASVSIFVQPGFAPELEITAGPSDGATFFVPAGATSDFTMGWGASVDYYYGAIQGYSYRFPAGGINDWVPVSEDLTSATLASLGASDTPYEVHIKAVDMAGNETEETVSFEIVTPTLDQGVLVVNGVDWGTYSDGSGGEAPGDPWEMYVGLPLSKADGRTFWDWFTGFADYPEGYEPIAHGNLSGAELGKYSTLVWMAAYNEDFASNQSLIKSFISAGGKFMIHGHNLPSYLDGDFIENYAHITWGTADVSVNADNPIIALESGLVDMGPGNGMSSASLSDLMALDDSGLSEGIFAYGSPEGELIGVKSKLRADGPYQVVLIGARPFRLDLDAMRTNYQYILGTVFGE